MSCDSGPTAHCGPAELCLVQYGEKKLSDKEIKGDNHVTIVAIGLFVTDHVE